jgi:hypothetical protein
MNANDMINHLFNEIGIKVKKVSFEQPKTYTIDGKYITIKDKDLYKFLGGKLRPLTEFIKWEEEVMRKCKP